MHNLTLKDFNVKKVKDFTLMSYKRPEGHNSSFVALEFMGKKTIIVYSGSKKIPMTHNNLLFLAVKHQKVPKELLEMSNLVSGTYNRKEKKIKVINTHGKNKNFLKEINSVLKKRRVFLQPKKTKPRIKRQKIKRRILCLL